MLKGLGTNFMVSYEKNEFRNNLVISTHNIENFRKNRVDILKRCFINFLPLYISKGNGNLFLKYDTTNKVRLSEFIKNKKIKTKTFLDILSEVTNIIKKSNVNKLDSNSIVIDEEAIYIDPKTNKLYMIYVPVDLDSDMIGNLKSFLVNLVMFLIKFEESNSEKYIEKILSLLKSTEFNVFSLDELISELKLLHEKEKKKVDEEEIDTKMIGDFSRKIIEVESKIINHNKDRIVTNNNDKNKLFINKILFQVLVMGILGLVILFTNYYNFLNDMKYIYILCSALGLTISIWLWRDYFNKSSEDKVLVNLLSDGAVNKNKSGYFNSNNINQPAFSTSLAGDQTIIAGDQTIINEDTMFLDDYGDYESNYSYRLKESKNKKQLDKPLIELDNLKKIEFNNRKFNENIKNPVIEITENGFTRKIEINKDEFIVGRLKGSVDLYTGNGAVGRKHAKIVKTGNNYYLIDLESRNGTFLNGKRIRSNIEYLIKDKDKLIFANTKIKINM